MSSLKLAALDSDDLSVLSLHMQDATLLVGDIRFIAKAGKLILIANRFDWEAEGPDPVRHRAGLHFDRVRKVRARRIRRDSPLAVLSLLSIAFEPDAEEPGGEIVLVFSGGGELRAEVECIEARLEDLPLSWTASGTPHHPIEQED